MRDEVTEARIRAQTHVFNNIRPRHPDANAMCMRCGLVLPQGPILAIGPDSLPPCTGPRTMHEQD